MKGRWLDLFTFIVMVYKERSVLGFMYEWGDWGYVSPFGLGYLDRGYTAC